MLYKKLKYIHKHLIHNTSTSNNSISYWQRGNWEPRYPQQLEQIRKTYLQMLVYLVSHFHSFCKVNSFQDLKKNSSCLVCFCKSCTKRKHRELAQKNQHEENLITKQTASVCLKYTDQLYQQHSAKPEYTSYSNAGRNSAFHEHHFLSFQQGSFHFPAKK